MIQGLGKRLREQRVALKLSQKEAAESIGISATLISNYERGERTPSAENLMSLASLYRCSTDYLLGLEKTPASIIDTSMLNEEQRKILQLFLSSLNC